MVTRKIVLGLVTVIPGISATAPDYAGVTARMVITALPAKGSTGPASLGAGNLIVLQGGNPAPVIGLQSLSGGLSGMQLFVLLDDSTRSSSLGIQLPELRVFIESLPPTTEVAVGYMRNGSFGLVQPFTNDHRKAGRALRLPAAVPGENGSPYFVLSDLVKHWPSKEPAYRRAVLTFTDGVDRYYTTRVMDDPYVDAALDDALKQGVAIYSVYLRGAGLYGRDLWTTTIAQSRLIEVSEDTGGYAYFQDFTDPVSISPFLKDLRDRFDHQYQVTFRAQGQKGFQPVKLRTETPGLKISGPSRIYVP